MFYIPIIIIIFLKYLYIRIDNHVRGSHSHTCRIIQDDRKFELQKNRDLAYRYSNK